MRLQLSLFACAALALAACSGGGNTTLGTGGNATGGGGTGGAPDPTASLYPDIASLHALGVARTCALNEGVCHSQRQYPELGAVSAFASLVGAPCQLGIQDSTQTLPECETRGDSLFVGGQDYEILQLTIAPGEPFPPRHVDLKVSAIPANLEPTNVRIHRPAPAGGDSIVKSLDGVALSAGSDSTHVVLDLTAAADPTLAGFLDIRAWHGDRVRLGDPNNDGMAHTSASPWAEITPGDPARSLFYKRLLSDKYGPQMPLIPRTWSASATRAVWCWIRGLPKDATSATVDVNAPIDYASCPPDPDAPDPNASGGWPSVKLLLSSKCATAPCHSTETHSAGLDLTPDHVQKDVINVPSSQAPTVLRVSPGQPAASYLLCKIDPECTARAQGTTLMPQGAMALSDVEIKTVADWISSGAPTE
jgi:hypothetical protein